MRIDSVSVKDGICDICDSNTTIELHYGNMWFCKSCWDKESEATKSHLFQNESSRIADSRIAGNNPNSLQSTDSSNPINTINEVISKSREIDEKIQVRTDLFNSATIAIVELKKSIDSDSEITNKPYRLAEELKNRFTHYKNVVFELNQKIIEAGNHQKAIQVYLNNLANQLRAEEREKLKIQDLSYQPTPVTSVKVKRVGTSQTNRKTKIDKTSLRNAASQLGLELGQPIPEFMLQTIIVARGVSIDEAVSILRKSIQFSLQK